MSKIDQEVPQSGAAMTPLEIDAKSELKMQNSERDWKTLQKNVGKILKKEISMKDLKHIVAVLNVMESVGMEFNQPVAQVAATMATTQSVANGVLDIEKMRDLLLQGRVSIDEFQQYVDEIIKKKDNSDLKLSFEYAIKTHTRQNKSLLKSVIS